MYKCKNCDYRTLNKSEGKNIKLNHMVKFNEIYDKYMVQIKEMEEYINWDLCS